MVHPPLYLQPLSITSSGVLRSPCIEAVEKNSTRLRATTSPSMRPLVERRPVEWRDHLVMEMQTTGRAVRTKKYKYVDYEGDPQKQLFDMDADPWELENLYGREEYEDVVKEHRRLIDEWEAQVEPSAKLSETEGRET